MIIRGIKVGSRSALTARQDGTVVWNPPIDIPAHSYTWTTNSRVMIEASNALVNLRSSTTISANTLLRAVVSTRHRGTVLEGPIYDVSNLFWWYRVRWDDPTLPNMATNQGCWVGANELANVVENRAPVATAQTLTATVGTPITITLSGIDDDDDALTYAVTVPATLGTYVGSTYTPTSPGVDSITFRANDGSLDSAPATITITNSAAPPVGTDPTVVISHNGWSIVAYSSQETTNEQTPATNAIDGSNATFWHSKWSGTPAAAPHFITVDLSVTQQVLGIRYLPRQDGGVNGAFTAYTVETSTNGSTWTTSASGTWTHDLSNPPTTLTVKEVLFTKTPARFLRITSTGDARGSMANLDVLCPQSEVVIIQPPVVEPPPPTDNNYPDPAPRTSVTKNGVTWTFSGSKLCGQYCNGDWWVVGPVTITSITPASTVRTESLLAPNLYNGSSTFDREVNGTMVNPYVQTGADPKTPNAFDNAVTNKGVFNSYAQYSNDLNVSPGNTGQALVCANGTSVVSSISTVGLPVISSTQVAAIAILTVVSAAPSPGSFRPPPTGTDKSHLWNKSQLNYGILSSRLPVASTPSITAVEAAFANSWTTFHTGNAIQSMSPGQMPNYGKKQSQDLADALLLLNLNYSNAVKERLYICLVQYGIDIYGFLRDGGMYRGAGGLNSGHKTPLVLAALALNDANMKLWADGAKRVPLAPNNTQVPPFFEDAQMFVVQQSDVGRVLYTADGRPREMYRQEHVGLPEWGDEHAHNPSRDGSNWTAYYRDINGAAHSGIAMGMRMVTGAKTLWNNNTFFNYCARYWTRESANGFDGQSFTAGGNGIPRFHYDMISTYTNSY